MRPRDFSQYLKTWTWVYTVPVWIALKPALGFVSCIFSFLFFFFFFLVSYNRGQRLLFNEQQPHFFLLFCPFITSVDPVHCSWNPQISHFSNFFIKNGSYDTIHTFKNYFAIMFSVSVFNFNNNKFNPNKPIVSTQENCNEKIGRAHV